MHGISRAVQPAIRKQVRAQGTGFQRVVFAADVEAGIVERTPAVVERQEREVAALLDRDQHGALLALERFERRQLGVAAGIGAGVDQCFAIARHHAHARAGHGRTVGDGLHEHIALPTERAFQHHAEIGQHHQPAIAL